MRKYKVRIADKILEKRLLGKGAVLIEGAKWCGKTTTAEQIAGSILYMADPEKFWKIANRYYNTHKAWVSGRNIEKLEKFIRQEDERERFLEMMRHFTLQPPAS